jgi:hypothetical protein
MHSLFDPRAGLGLSYLRQPMGASDFVAGPHYTYDDVPAGQTDFRLRHFSIAHDRAEILPLLRQALRLNPRRCSPTRPPATTSTAPPSTATRAIPSASPSFTTPSRPRTSTSPNAQDPCPVIRRRPSPKRCTGTPAS